MTPEKYNNAITATTFVRMNQWSERTFYKALNALRQYNKEQAGIIGLQRSGELLDFEWRLPTFDTQEQRWIDVEPEQRGITVVLTWLLT